MKDDPWISPVTQRALQWGVWAAVAVALLGSLLLVTTPVQAQTRHLVWNEARIPVPGGQLAFAKAGFGPLLVVLPGGPGEGGDGLRAAFESLTNDATVVLLDPIGRGRSDRLADPSGYTLARDVEDLERLRQHFGAPRIAIYGHSYGGLVAQQYAAGHPQRVRRLVLGNTLPGASAWQAQLAAQRADTRSALAAPPLHLRLGGAGADVSTEVQRAMLGPDPARRIDGTLRGVELLPQLATVTAPTLLLTGRHDALATPRLQQQMAQALLRARASVLVFEHSGHQPFYDEPRAWTLALRSFLR